MHPYSDTKRRVSLTIDHFTRAANGRKQAVAYDADGNPHYQFVKESGSRRKSRSYRRRRSRH